MARKIIGFCLIIISLGLSVLGFFGLTRGIVFGGIAILVAGILVGSAGYQTFRGASFQDIANTLRWLP